MKKQFTEEEKKLKLETNIKSAMTGYFLSGVLGIIYIVRFIITKNFDFYFSLAFNEFFLRRAHNEGSYVFAYVLIAAYMAVYFIVALIAGKNSKRLSVALGMYVFDCVFLIPLFIMQGEIRPEMFIDVIVHAFVIIFLVVGVKSAKEKV